MIIIFIGPPFSGKDTQTKLLSEKLNLPTFGMGKLIRDAYSAGDENAVEMYEKYSLKGLHVPIELKFNLLKKELDSAIGGYILDNFPATSKDLDALNGYLKERDLKIDKVFNLAISEQEMESRIKQRGRKDDDPEIIRKRREIQDEDRVAVLDYFKQAEILEEVDGEREIETIHNDILNRLKTGGFIND